MLAQVRLVAAPLYLLWAWESIVNLVYCSQVVSDKQSILHIDRK
jgi:hypothetical protein